MINRISVSNNAILKKQCIKNLKQRKVDIPSDVYSAEWSYVLNNRQNKETCIVKLKDVNDYIIKLVEFIVDKATGKETRLERTHSYLGVVGKKRKISSIREKVFDENNHLEKETKWNFYYPSNGENVLFSKNLKSEKVDNFKRVDDYVTDSNGFKIHPISIAEYLDLRNSVTRGQYVDNPWTPNESVTNKIAMTDNIEECTAIGIVGKKGISLGHYNPNNPTNFKFDRIGRNISRLIKIQGESAKAFVIGSLDSDRKSMQQFKNIIDVVTKNKIPYSNYQVDATLHSKIMESMPDELSVRKAIKQGLQTTLYLSPGQHVIFSDGEIKITNRLIDKEIQSGNKDAKQILEKAFLPIQ